MFSKYQRHQVSKLKIEAKVKIIRKLSFQLQNSINDKRHACFSKSCALFTRARDIVETFLFK